MKFHGRRMRCWLGAGGCLNTVALNKTKIERLNPEQTDVFPYIQLHFLIFLGK